MENTAKKTKQKKTTKSVKVAKTEKLVKSKLTEKKMSAKKVPKSIVAKKVTKKSSSRNVPTSAKKVANLSLVKTKKASKSVKSKETRSMAKKTKASKLTKKEKSTKFTKKKSIKNQSNQLIGGKVIKADASSHRRNFMLVGTFLVIAIAVFGVYTYAEKPAQGHVIVTNNMAATNQDVIVPKIFDGKFLSFTFDSQFIIKSHDMPTLSDSVISEQAYLSNNGMSSKKIVLVVRKNPTHNLNDVPDYTLRKSGVGQYSSSTFSFDGVAGESFVPTAVTTFEKTYFIQNGDHVAILTITAPVASDDKLEKEADLVIKSISWKK